MNRNSACNCRKMPAVARSAVIRKIALCTTLRRVTTRIAETMARAAKKWNTIWSSIIFLVAQRLFAVRFLQNATKPDSQEWLSYLTLTHHYVRFFLLLFRRCQPTRDGQRDQSRQPKCRPVAPSPVAVQHEGHADSHHVDDGKRNQELPAQAHQLIEPVPREREPQPHE